MGETDKGPAMKADGGDNGWIAADETGHPNAPDARCPECGYLQTGLSVEHRCPECGFTYDPRTTVWRGPASARHVFVWSLLTTLAVVATWGAAAALANPATRTPLGSQVHWDRRLCVMAAVLMIVAVRLVGAVRTLRRPAFVVTDGEGLRISVRGGRARFWPWDAFRGVVVNAARSRVFVGLRLGDDGETVDVSAVMADPQQAAAFLQSVCEERMRFASRCVESTVAESVSMRGAAEHAAESVS